MANLALARFAHKCAKFEGPLPPAVARMLGLTPRLGQANAERGYYDFSLAPMTPKRASFASAPGDCIR
jgi:hypothetical protein